MALDGAFLYAVKTELMPLIGGRVDKIHQPSREEILITIRTRSGAKKLYISANAGDVLYAPEKAYRQRKTHQHTAGRS